MMDRNNDGDISLPEFEHYIFNRLYIRELQERYEHQSAHQTKEAKITDVDRVAVLSDMKNNLKALLLAASMVEKEASRNSGLRVTKTALLWRASTKHIDEDKFSDIPHFFAKTFGTIVQAINHTSSVHPRKEAAPAGTAKAGAPGREENGLTETKLAIDAGKARKKLTPIKEKEARKKGKESGALQILVKAKGESA